MYEGQWRILMVIADRLEHGVDHALGRGAHVWIRSPGPAHGGHLAVSPHHPPIGGNPVDPCLAHGKMRAGLQSGHGFAGCLRRPGPHLFGPVASHNDVGMPVGVENVLGIAVGPGGIVGVGAVHGHPIGIGSHGHGQCLAPAVVIAVAQFGPVQGAQDDGRLIVRH